MKHLARLLIVPVLLTQLSYSPTAKADDNWWQGAIAGAVTGAVVAGVVTYAIMNQNDQQQMNSNVNLGFRADLRIGDHSPEWHTQDGHTGYFVYQAQGSAPSLGYNTCRRVVPMAFDANHQPINTQGYAPVIACQNPNNQNSWLRIDANLFSQAQTAPGPFFTGQTYENNSPFSALTPVPPPQTQVQAPGFGFPIAMNPPYQPVQAPPHYMPIGFHPMPMPQPQQLPLNFNSNNNNGAFFQIGVAF